MTEDQIKTVAESCQRAGLSIEEALRYSHTDMSLSPEEWFRTQDDPRSVEEYQKIMNPESTTFGKADLSKM